MPLRFIQENKVRSLTSRLNILRGMLRKRLMLGYSKLHVLRCRPFLCLRQGKFSGIELLAGCSSCRTWPRTRPTLPEAQG